MNRPIAMLLATVLALSAVAAPRNKTNILTIKESITDNNIEYPASFETNTHELMKNWYLQNYTLLNADVESHDASEVSDAEYIKRLQAMPTIIEMPYNQVVRSYIDRYVKRNRTLVEEMLGMSLYYMPIFEEALEREGLPLELKYLPVIESALDPSAVSPAGAAGLWQFMVGTGKGLGLEVNSLVDERRDPYKSSEKAAKLLKDLFSIYGDWSLAIASYNCGPGNVNKALRRVDSDTNDFWQIYYYLPRETRGYVPAFIAANYVMTYYKRHNISPVLASKPLITDTIHITRRVHFNQISQVLGISVDALRALNPQYRQDIIPATVDHPYTLTLPSQQIYSYMMSEDSIAAYHPDIYAQRAVVEPGDDAGSEGSYTYMTTTTTHKVRRGETYTSIASNYGMDVKTLMSLNGVSGGKPQRGQVLKVQTRQRVRVDDAIDEEQRNAEGNELAQEAQAEQEQIAEVQEIERAAKEKREFRAQTPPKTTTNTTAATTTQRTVTQPPKRTEKASQKGTNDTSHNGKQRGRQAEKTKEKAKPTEYTVKRGETLSQISARTGVPVATLKEANGIKGDNIKAGTKLKLAPDTPKGKKGKGAKAQAETTKKGGKASKTSGKAAKEAKSTKSSKNAKAAKSTKSTTAKQPAKTKKGKKK